MQAVAPLCRKEPFPATVDPCNRHERTSIGRDPIAGIQDQSWNVTGRHKSQLAATPSLKYKRTPGWRSMRLAPEPLLARLALRQREILHNSDLAGDGLQAMYNTTTPLAFLVLSLDEASFQELGLAA